MTPLLQRFSQVLRYHQLVEPGQRVLVAVSGGVDSVCLLLLLSRAASELSIDLAVAHYNHGLRGEDSFGDAIFVEQLARRLEVPIVSEEAPANWWQREPGTKMEAARRLRYDFLQRAARELKAQRIALGHHADDQAETVIFHLLRGSGLTGLAGIPMIRGPYIRPLLHFRRPEIEAYLVGEGQSWRHDLSNDSDAYTRNRIRHQVMPLLLSFNPRFVEAVGRASSLLRADAQYLEDQAIREYRRLVDAGRLAIEPLLLLPVTLRRRVLRMFLREVITDLAELGDEPMATYVGLDKTDEILDILKRRPDKTGQITQVAGFHLVKESGFLMLFRELPWAEPVEFMYPVPIPDDIHQARSLKIPEAKGMLEVTRLPKTDGKSSASHVYFDEEILRYGPLFLRNRRAGDRFWPTGLDGSKKVKDYFIEQKVPRRLREQIPLLVAGETVLWVVGHRADKRYLATSQSHGVVALKWHREMI